VNTPVTGHRGFTLVELLSTVSVFAILLSIGVPSFRSYSASQSIRTAGFSLTSSLILARSEAVKRNNPVTISAVGSNWAHGWAVTATGATADIFDAGPLNNGVTVASGAPPFITFDASGRVTGVAGIVQLPLSVASGSQTLNRCISLDPSGMPKSTQAPCS
jgi:type IV fimbrial biogenesis protein FimT